MAEGIEFDDRVVRRNLERIVKAAPEIEAKAVRKASKPVFALSQKLVPLDRGPLRGSAKVATAAKGDTITTFISYGHPGSRAEKYAQAVHEHPSEHSPLSWKGDVHWQQRSSRRAPGSPRQPGEIVKVGVGSTGLSNITQRGPKFLERAVYNSRGSFNREVGEEIMRLLKGA